MTEMMTWRPATDEDYERLKGRTVYDVDLGGVGTLCAVFYPPLMEMPEARGRHYFLVETSPTAPDLGRDELYLAEETIQNVSQDGIILAVPRDRLKGDLGRAPANLNGFRRS